MTDPLYARAQATSLRLLTKYGQDVTLRTYTTGTYNTATGKNTVVTADTTRKGLKLGLPPNETTIRGELIQTEDTTLLLEASGQAPNLQDHLIVQGVEYSIVSIADTNPAGVPVLYNLHLRRGG